MHPTNCKKIFTILKKNNPHPQTELHYKTKFELLIAVMLSAQATDISVNKATAILFKVANTPKKILALKEAGLKNHIKRIGLYNTKAKNIIKTCHLLINRYDNQIPSTREALESLPGVGRKTANVILNIAFNQPTIAVDTHIFRVSNRTKLATGNTPLTVEKKLAHIIPIEYRQDAHHWLVLHGRYICLARKPKCTVCPIYNYCEYEKKKMI